MHTCRVHLLGQVHPLDAEHMANLSLLLLDIQMCYYFFGMTVASLRVWVRSADGNPPSVLPSLLLLFARAVGSQSNAVNEDSKQGK